MKTTEIIGYIAIAVIIVSLFFIGIEFTGYVVTDNETGVVNVSIAQQGALLFNTSLLDFGSGAVSGSATRATLDSEGTKTDWTGDGTEGQLVLQNVGNVNVTLTLSTNDTVDNFIGGDTPTFEAKVTDNKTDSCTVANFTGGYQEINQTLQIACDPLEFDPDRDAINIDFNLTIANDALGDKTIGIVAIGTYS